MALATTQPTEIAVISKGNTLTAYKKITRPGRKVARITELVSVIAVAWGIAASTAGIIHAQSGQTSTTAGYVLPEPIYWKQTLFQIPYQWNSAAEPSAAHTVYLHLSKDGGASWQKISDARPNVSSFNYRAEGDGEYWFAVRTVDHQGRVWPASEFHPELRVIVDTSMPRIDRLQAELRNSGTIEITWSGFDSNLDPDSWKFETQSDPTGPWQPLPWSNLNAGTTGVPRLDSGGQHSGRAVCQLPPGQSPIAVRATVSDRAGNSASFRSEVQLATGGTGVVTRLPAVAPGPIANNQPAINPFVSTATNLPTQPLPGSTTATPNQGWVSGSEARARPTLSTTQPTDQSWPASTTAHAPFRLWSSGVSTPGDSITSYGTPIAIDSEQVAADDANDASGTEGVSAKYAAANQSASPSAGPPFQPLQPFRQASETRLPATVVNASPRESAIQSVESTIDSTHLPPTDAYASQQLTNVNPKLIGSRTFALEYDLEDVGRWGVSKVELWGTRDEGRTWRMYAEDDDQRSPLVVTVDDEGRYGFRIVVQSAGGPEGIRPQPGDAPELWVAVDLGQPVAELTAIERGAGNTADQLILHWRAADDNLEARPISLYYSSRQNGPWSVVATNLQNTGQYAWRIERHVPDRFFLRLEVRDAAGNMSAFHTRESVEFAASAPSARLNSAESIAPSAIGAGVSYH